MQGTSTHHRGIMSKAYNKRKIKVYEDYDYKLTKYINLYFYEGKIYSLKIVPYTIFRAYLSEKAGHYILPDNNTHVKYVFRFTKM